MRIIDVTHNMPGFSEIKSLQQNSFPPSELWPAEYLTALALSPDISYKSFWKQNQLCGILFYITGHSLVYLLYIAVSEPLRSIGMGSELLGWLRKQSGDKTIVLNTEAIGQYDGMDDMRTKRLNFYLRNGFQRAPFQLKDDSGLYDILSSSHTLPDKYEFTQLINRLGFGAYKPKLIENGKEVFNLQ